MNNLYSLNTNLQEVNGIGPQLGQKLNNYNLQSVLDFLLWLPLRYEDRSHMVEIKDLRVGELVTIKATVQSARNYYKGRKSIQSATVFDETGKLKLMWFNNNFIIQKLKPQSIFFICGKINDRGVMIQPTVENVSDDTIHTARLIPIYPKISTIKQGSIRRLLKHILDNLNLDADTLSNLIAKKRFPSLELSLLQVFNELHFPSNQDKVVVARERLALEELLSLIEHSQLIKKKWQSQKKSFDIRIKPTSLEPLIPNSIPFSLTASQHKAVGEILTELQSSQPMNHLLLGDVGSGKTVVAGIAIFYTLKNGYTAAFIAPTQILAEQHAETLKQLFPKFDIQLLTSKTKKAPIDSLNSKAKVYVGTHSVINKLNEIKPALIIYDEQHRFGVSQRSFETNYGLQPNILTMSATPIPRSLMLTLFSHLLVSHLDELPPGRKPVKTWLTPHSKRISSWEWIAESIKKTNTQVFVVCPFIEPSETAEFENIASAVRTYEEMSEYFSKHHHSIQLGLLHGKMSGREKTRVMDELNNKTINILVTTPVIEVGLDVPNAGVIVIESCNRFGLASLHQLRGRVGRGNQQSYCILFTSKKGNNERLKQFASENNGLKLAEMDLQRRGAGDLFGTQQSGFENLKFAEWTNLSLITQARELYELLVKDNYNWTPLIRISGSIETTIAAN